MRAAAKRIRKAKDRSIAVAPLFRASYLHAVSTIRHKALTRRVASAAGLAIAREENVRSFMLRAYAHLISEHRGEYVYKNELLNDVILATHDPDASGILTEYQFAGAHSRADLVLVNETTTAYEIKSERDDTGRLGEQLRYACRVFEQVFVVCAQRHADAVASSVPKNVGVIVLHPGIGIISQTAASSNIEQLDAATIFLNLRARDYERIIIESFGVLPDVPPIEMWSACRKLFTSLSASAVHKAFLGTLRERFVTGDDGSRLKDVPRELTHLYYDIKPRLRSRLLSPAILGRPAV